MIRIRVDLISAKTGKTTQLAEMHICNDGTGTDKFSNYSGRVLRKPNFKSITKIGLVTRHDRHNLTVWHLISKMLKTMGY